MKSESRYNEGTYLFSFIPARYLVINNQIIQISNFQLFHIISYACMFMKLILSYVLRKFSNIMSVGISRALLYSYWVVHIHSTLLKITFIPFEDECSQEIDIINPHKLKS